MTIMQRIHETGLYIPVMKMSRKQCQEFWQSKTNASSSNSPIEYANKNLGMIETMVNVIEPHVSIHNSILELGSNCGVNLSYLQNNEFMDLNGIELNMHAIDEMRFSYPKLNADILHESLESGLHKYFDGEYDLVFSMAVLEHIHPSSNFIFDEIARISKRYICTCECEDSTGCSYIFERNYKRVFEKRGFKQIKIIHIKYGVSCYTLRMFKKYKQEGSPIIQ